MNNTPYVLDRVTISPPVVTAASILADIQRIDDPFTPATYTFDWPPTPAKIKAFKGSTYAHMHEMFVGTRHV